jgi:DNA-binding HxlR family transcriptional regulator
MVVIPAYSDCAIWLAMETISPKWTVHIILELMTAGEESLSYSDIQKLIPGINPRMLDLRLKSLVDDGLIDKLIENPDTPKKVRYKLTDSGEDLVSIITQIRSWALQNLKVNDRCVSNICRHAVEISKFLEEHPEKHPSRTLVRLEVNNT